MKLREYILGYELTTPDISEQPVIVEYTHIQEAMYHAIIWDTVYAETKQEAEYIFKLQNLN